MNPLAVRYMVKAKQQCIDELEVLMNKYDSLLKSSPNNDCKIYYESAKAEVILALSQVKALVIA